ncbi:hypothetical protein F511_17527 [Dorcoceras hygrometricum]|uniref:Uncharacterized protein n=1 Tax=Dorcoceras hygrometricum TaxID=472368 RepID=A0A2Z7C512_9LAMI|nr:hypothetical protein F511_17527 [Dorcoceras hygrometricum]
MQGQLDSSVTAFVEFLQSGTFDELTPPPRPRVGSFDQSWVVAYPSFRDDSPEFVFDTLLTACVHHRFLIVDYLGARSPVVSRANISWSLEFYNPALFSRQFGLSQVIPHLVLYYPMDILHLDSEIGSGRLSKATVELLAAASSSFLSPIHVYTTEDVSSFSAWWPPRRAVLAPTFDYPSCLILFLHICLFFLLHCACHSMFLAFAAKGKKSIAPASIDKSTIAPPVEAKSKKRKVSSAPPHSTQSSKGKKYSTRSSGRLKSRFSNTEADPVDLVSSSHITDDEEDNSEREGTPLNSPTADELIDDYFLHGQDIGLAPESALPSIPLDFSSRRAQLQELDSSSPDVDLSFADVEASTSSQLAKSFPSAESLSYARTAVHNFLELGLHQLGESQRLAMISAVSILKASPEFSAEHPLLDSIATIFSDSDVAQTKLTSLMAKKDDFHNKRRRAEAMEQENLSVRDQIRNLTVEYDVCEDVVKRLEREIAEQRSKMALILDEAETLKKTLLSNRSATRAVVDELAGLKSEYVDWTKEIRDSEEKQGECLLKWEQLRRLFC